MLLSVIALTTMVPALVQGLRPAPSRDGLFWGALAVGILGPLASLAPHAGPGWQTGFSATLWVTICAAMLLYAVVAALFRHAWRLLPLLVGYMLLLGILATVWQGAAGPALHASAADRAWIGVHIATAVVTYGLVTIAGIAAVAAVLQERTLKRKRTTALSRHLPSIADCERLQFTLLKYGWAVLAVGLASGMALQYRETGQLLSFDHKTVLTLAAFVVIGALLAAHRFFGVRGRRGARLVLLAYLLLTLGYPGVKFVTDVLLA